MPAELDLESCSVLEKRHMQLLFQRVSSVDWVNLEDLFSAIP